MTDVPGSPFPPIAEYAFLSNCHTGALIAPDGSVGWLCTPRFDSAKRFGNLLDRGAGYFRFGPYGINVPTHRAYTGNEVLVTTWHTPGGWVEIRDALTMAPRSGPDETTPHTRPPADDDAEHLLVRTAVCLAGAVEVELVCEPAFDYGRVPADWTLDGPGRTRRTRPGRGRRCGCGRIWLGHGGQRGPRSARAAGGRAGVLRAVLVGRPGRPADVDDAARGSR